MSSSPVPEHPTATPARRRSRRLQLWIGLLVSVAALVVVSQRVVWDEFVASLTEIRIGFLALGIVGLGVTLIFKAKRWQILLRPVGNFSWMGDAFRYYMIGHMLNMVMPLKPGELLRPWLFARKHGLSTISVLATVIVERMADVAMLLCLYACVLYFGLTHVQAAALQKTALVAAVLLALGLGVALTMTRARTHRALGSLILRLPSRYADRLSKMSDQWLAGLRSLRDADSLLGVAGTTGVIWLGGYVTLQCYLQGFGLHLPWFAPILLVVVANLGTMVPSSPGGVGVAHLLYAYALSVFEVDMSTAIAFAVVAHGIGYLSVVAVGLVALWYEGIALKDLGGFVRRGPAPSGP